MIGHAQRAYKRAWARLKDIESKIKAVDKYCMSLVLANANIGGSGIYGRVPDVTPYADFFTQAALTDMFAPFMEDVVLMAGKRGTVEAEPQAENAALLYSYERAFKTIESLLMNAASEVTSGPELQIVTEDTSALADNVATAIRGIGWQFAIPICKGAVRDAGVVSAITLYGDETHAYFWADFPFAPAAGASSWDTLHEGDSVCFEDISAVPASTGGITTFGAIHDIYPEESVSFHLPSGGVMTETLAPTAIGNVSDLGFQGFLLRKSFNNPTP